jgi:anti-sigma regulatory factor (Ser/Thr protein kinase)
MTSGRWSFAAMPEAPEQGRRAIRQFASSAEPTANALTAIAICVSEAITNVVMHAYRDREQPGDLKMLAEFDGDWLCVRVRDHGNGLTPRPDSPGAGLGLPLIAQMSTDWEILTTRHGGTEIIMRFDVHQDDEAGG